MIARFTLYVLFAGFICAMQTTVAATWTYDPQDSDIGQIYGPYPGGIPGADVGFIKNYDANGTLHIFVSVERTDDEARSYNLVSESVQNSTGSSWDGFTMALYPGGSPDDAAVRFGGEVGESDTVRFADIAGMETNVLTYSQGSVGDGEWFNPFFNIQIDWGNTLVGESVGFILEQTPNSSVVPVPAAVWLFGSAMVGLVGFSRKKARIAAA